MKLKANKFELKKTVDGDTEVILTIDDKKNIIFKRLKENKALNNTVLEVELNKFRVKRKVEHNALFWDMCNYLADFINDPLLTPNDIYKDLIRDYGVSTIYPIQDEILDMFIKSWESRGMGWLTEIQRKSNLKGDYTNIKCWFGSSVYDSKMMWKLVEGLKQMCRDNELDISHYDTQLQASMKALEEQEIAYEKHKNKSN